MSRRSPRFVLLFVAALTPRAALARAPEASLPAEQIAAVDKAVREEMEKQKVVGLALGVIRDGKVAYLKGYGLANREKKIAVTTDSVFNWASNSKPLAAVATMQLVEKKLLDLDADVRKYVPEFPDKGKVITARHLLCHQSGIPHYTNGKVIPTEKKYANAQPFLDPVVALDKFNHSPLIFDPGEKTDYSSYAYILLSAVVQRAGKEPFDRQVQQRIAKPAGMKLLALDVETKNQPNWTVGYVRGKDGASVAAKEEAHYWKHGAGAYKSNIGDFARWAEALLNRKLVSEETEKAMWTRQKTADGKETNWGLGFGVADQNGLRVSHNGAQDEATTRLVISPGARHGVVVMTNCRFADVGAFTTAVSAALNGK